MCLYRNLVFVFGGTGFPFGVSVSNVLHILDLKRRHWKRLQLTNQQPEEVYGAVRFPFRLLVEKILNLNRV